MRLLSTLLLLVSTTSYAQSIQELTESAQNQNIHAQFQLAQRYELGDGVEASESEAFYWYEQAALNGNHNASIHVGQGYLWGKGTKADPENAIFWLSKAASEGSTQAPSLLGKLYEDLNTPANNLDLAELWYQEAMRFDPNAEERYAKVLEQQFNNRRAKQVAAIDQLEVAFDTSDIEVSPKARSLESSTASYNMTIYGLLATLLLTTVAVVWLMRKNHRLKSASSESDLSTQQRYTKLERELKRRDEQLKQQKRQLESMYRHIKKQQVASAQQPQNSPQKAEPAAQDKPLTLACALFGFSPSTIPDEKQIKARYKQLSKIYHPDLKGSDAEMKRLNQALKLIVKHVNK
ncbi:J domain-containing protein [Vibrio aquaticus]|uniref:J domain-containing protein n=1 Tax=Vibrio aquaticus TaxID=2496559 RepID=A0A432CVX0_9VIBR|nr:J domain-containing protein [Vibrio aquaticus]RTZ14421.1 J domain-containing protein [Vibrio aquaticus]